MGPWGRAAPFSSCLNLSYMHHCSTSLKAASQGFITRIRLILCMARTWVLQSGSSWPIIVRAVYPNIVLPKSLMMVSGLPSLVFLHFCVIFHFFPLQWSRVECNSQCAVAERRVRHAVLCAPAEVLLTELQPFVCNSGFEYPLYWAVPAGGM